MILYYFITIQIGLGILYHEWRNDLGKLPWEDKAYAVMLLTFASVVSVPIYLTVTLLDRTKPKED